MTSVEIDSQICFRSLERATDLWCGDVSGVISTVVDVDECFLGREPKSLEFHEAATSPLTSIIARKALFHRLPIGRSGEHGKLKLLIIGAARGVGYIVIQLDKHVAQLHVIASRERLKTWCLYLGASHVIKHNQDTASSDSITTS